MHLLQVYDGPKSYTNKFVCVVHERPEGQNKILIEYVGDDTAAAHFPHGSSKEVQRNYLRTQPHVLHDIRTATGSAQTIYRTMNATPASDSMQSGLPRNTEQVRNVLKGHRNHSRFTHDALNNIHEVAFDIGFGHEIKTFPDLSVIAYHPEFIEVFR